MLKVTWLRNLLGASAQTLIAYSKIENAVRYRALSDPYQAELASYEDLPVTQAVMLSECYLHSYSAVY